MKTPVILIVNSNRSELETLVKELEQEGYVTIAASSLEEMDSAIKGKEKTRLVLLDLAAFDDSVWERCESMHEAKIPFIVLMPQRSPSLQRDSMKHGASGLLVKPVATKELIEYIHTALGD